MRCLLAQVNSPIEAVCTTQWIPWVQLFIIKEGWCELGVRPGVEPAVTPSLSPPCAQAAGDLVVSNTPELLASLLINHAEMKGCLEAEDECSVDAS